MIEISTAAKTIRGLSMAAALFCISCGEPHSEILALATTTSVQNSGLLDAVLPTFEEQTHLRIQVHATGSGRALAMLENGDVDVAISHSPSAEANLVAKHPEYEYRKFAFNAFVIVGPVTDPAHVKGISDAAAVFRRIAESGATFVSRGDESGTHEREKELWAAAGLAPSAERLIVSGRGMAQALRHTSEARRYTLTDAPTFWQLRDDVDLVIVSEGDRRLVNSYAVIHRRGVADADRFAGWLLSGAGRALVDSFLINEKRAYELWPVDCPATVPQALPCSHGSGR